MDGEAPTTKVFIFIINYHVYIFFNHLIISLPTQLQWEKRHGGAPALWEQRHNEAQAHIGQWQQRHSYTKFLNLTVSSRKRAYTYNLNIFISSSII